MKIICDLDGTILDFRQRYFEVFKLSAPEINLTEESYWEIRKDGSHNKDVLFSQKYTKRSLESFEKAWMKNIERDEFLKFDVLYPGIEQSIKRFKRNRDNQIYICTARQNFKSTISQLESLGILKYTSDVFVTEKKTTKADLLLRSSVKLSANDWFIGDTAEDMDSGETLKIQTALIRSNLTPSWLIRKTDRSFENAAQVIDKLSY